MSERIFKLAECSAVQPYTLYGTGRYEMPKVIGAVLLIGLVIITGCSKDVRQGQILHRGSLYEVRVPEEGLQAEPNTAGPDSLALNFSDELMAYFGGRYYIIPYPVSNFGSGPQVSLESVLPLTIMGTLQRGLPEKFEVLKQERSEWNGLPAIYSEWFVAGEFRKLSKYGTETVRDNFCYAGMFVKKETHYFWILYCDPIDSKVIAEQKIKIKPETRTKLAKFLDGVNLLPKRKGTT